MIYQVWWLHGPERPPGGPVVRLCPARAEAEEHAALCREHNEVVEVREVPGTMTPPTEYGGVPTFEVAEGVTLRPSW